MARVPFTTAPNPDDELSASVLLGLIVDFSWIHRRVESVEVVDDTTLRRRTSIDFSLPTTVNGVEVAPHLPFVPLTLLQKEILRNFDLRNAEGRAVPVLTTSQNRRYAGAALVATARSVLGDEVPSTVARHLYELAGATRQRAEFLLEFWKRLADDPSYPDRRVWAELLGRPEFEDLAATLAENFVLGAVVNLEPGDRHVYKLSYDEGFNPVATIRERLGWDYRSVSFDVSHSRLCESYHLEVTAPRDMAVGVLVVEADGGTTVDGVNLSRAHVHTPRLDEGERALATAYFRVPRGGFLRSALGVAALAWALLLVGVVELDALTRQANSQTAAALLLLAPTFMAAAIIRPGEHEFATASLLGVRLLVVLSMSATLLATLVLAGLASGDKAAVWDVGFGLSSVAVVMLVRSYRGPRERRLFQGGGLNVRD